MGQLCTLLNELIARIQYFISSGKTDQNRTTGLLLFFWTVVFTLGNDKHSKEFPIRDLPSLSRNRRIDASKKFCRHLNGKHDMVMVDNEGAAPTETEDKDSSVTIVLFAKCLFFSIWNWQLLTKKTVPWTIRTVSAAQGWSIILTLVIPTMLSSMVQNTRRSKACGWWYWQSAQLHSNTMAENAWRTEALFSSQEFGLTAVSNVKRSAHIVAKDELTSMNDDDSIR